MTDHLRTIRLSADDGYRYTLTMRATSQVDSRGQTRIAYTLKCKAPESGRKPYTVLFEGDDYSGSPMHADDSDATVAGLLGFLSLKPGDTDPDYFDGYTTAQRLWAESHAEYLGYARMHRFGDES
jgi:hypothetical protein